MAVYRITFVVQGVGHFPTDMLRYDKCHPRHPRDVDNISITREDREEFNQPRKVNLALLINTSKSNAERLFKEGLQPTEGRWASFGWPVVEKWIETANSL